LAKANRWFIFLKRAKARSYWRLKQLSELISLLSGARRLRRRAPDNKEIASAESGKKASKK